MLLVLPVLVALLLVVAACNAPAGGGGAAPAAATDTPAAVATDTPAAEATATEAMTSTESMTSTEGMTSSETMTSSEGMTSTEGTTSTEVTTSTEQMTSTGGTSSTGTMTGTEQMTNTGGMSGTGSTGAGEAAMIMVTKNAEYGDILTDGQGRSVYLFTNDSGDKSSCNGSCAQNWPPVIANGQAMAGDGVDQSLLGTTTRDDGTTQVTYNGHPIYYYAKDANPGDTNGHQVGDVWYLVTVEGNEVGG
jgi:predicted lipoprotein with Yx(FWY)xxD motif